MGESQGEAFQAEGTAIERTLRQASLGCGRDGKAGTVALAEWAGDVRSAKTGLAGPVGSKSSNFILSVVGGQEQGRHGQVGTSK